MATCFDVAKYILTKMGKLSTVKLQKLVYYAQAWSLVWDDEPLFNERIEAWLRVFKHDLDMPLEKWHKIETTYLRDLRNN